MIDDYLEEPLNVTIYDPILQKELKTFHLPIVKTRGGGLDLDILDTDITQLRKSKAHIETYREEPNSVGIYPTDTIYDLRYKLSVVTGIPLFRQNIMYKKKDRKELLPIYSLYIGNELIDVDITQNLTNKNDTLLGIPIDKRIYNAKQDIKAEVHDLSIMLKGSIRDIILVDLFTILDPSREFLQIEFQKEILYYGFVVKYFPCIPYTGYIQVYDQKSHIEFIYSDLKPPYARLQRQYELGKKLLDKVITNTPKIIKEYKDMTTRDMYFLTSAIVTFDIPVLEPRMFIDRFELDKYYVYIAANLPIGTKIFNVNKKYNTYTGEVFNDNAKMVINTIYIQTINGIKIYIKKNKVHIEMRYSESSKITYQDAKDLVKEIHTYLNTIITVMGKVVTKDGITVGVGKPVVTSSDVQLVWPQSVLSTVFIGLREYLIQYEDAYMLKVLATEAGGYALQLKYGVTYNSPGLGYDYYINKDIRDQVNSKRFKPLHILQETSHISIIIDNISEEEFSMNIYIILNIIYDYLKNTAKTNIVLNTEDINRRLKRLKSMDPDLYDIKKYNDKAQVYSIKCQLGRQPIIYRDSEFKTLPVSIQKKLVKFWNFTENRSAYYHCPNKTFPHLSFMPRSHPLGYCLPCCKKKLPRKDSVQNKIDTECLISHSINAKKLEDILSGKHKDRHILTYGKKVPKGRESYGPRFLDKHYRLLGIGDQQEVPMALINSIIFLLEISITDFMKDILGIITEHTFPLLDIGHLKNVMNHKSLKSALFSVIMEGNGDIIDTNYIDWGNILSELLYMAYGINLIVLVDTGGKYTLKVIRTTEMAIITEEKMNDYIIVVEHGGGMYPLAYNILTQDDTEEKKYSFEITDSLMKFIRQSIIYEENDRYTFDLVNIIKFLGTQDRYEVDTLLRGVRGYIYAVILKVADKDCRVFVPIVYTEFLSDEFNIEEEFVDKYYKLPRSELYTFLDIYSGYLARNKTSFKLSFLLRYKGKFVGINITFGSDRYGFTFYFKEEETEGRHKGLKVIDIPYDIISINKSIRDGDVGESNAPLTKEAEKYLYENNIYNLFLIEFASEMRKHKNKKVRDELEPVLKANIINKKKVRDILHECAPKDISSIMDIIDTYDKRKVWGIFEGIMFGFDMVAIDKIKAKPKEDRVEPLDKLLRHRITIVKTLPNRISNNFISCNYDHSQPQCTGSKLAMLGKDYKKCLSSLAQDLDNTYIYETLVLNIIGNINPLSFIQRPAEIVSIVEV